MINIIVFILSCYGITQIITKGSVFNAIRPKHKFWCCSMCVGYWVGMLLFVVFWFGNNTQLFESFLLGSLVFGGIGSGTSYFLGSIVNDFGFSISKN